MEDQNLEEEEYRTIRMSKQLLNISGINNKDENTSEVRTSWEKYVPVRKRGIELQTKELNLSPGPRILVKEEINGNEHTSKNKKEHKKRDSEKMQEKYVKENDYYINDLKNKISKNNCDDENKKNTINQREKNEQNEFQYKYLDEEKNGIKLLDSQQLYNKNDFKNDSYKTDWYHCQKYSEINSKKDNIKKFADQRYNRERSFSSKENINERNMFTNYEFMNRPPISNLKGGFDDEFYLRGQKQSSKNIYTADLHWKPMNNNNHLRKRHNILPGNDNQNFKSYPERYSSADFSREDKKQPRESFYVSPHLKESLPYMNEQKQRYPFIPIQKIHTRRSHDYHERDTFLYNKDSLRKTTSLEEDEKRKKSLNGTVRFYKNPYPLIPGRRESKICVSDEEYILKNDEIALEEAAAIGLLKLSEMRRRSKK